MEKTAIRIDKCSDVKISNIISDGFDKVIHATETEKLEATNIVASINARDLEDLVCKFKKLLEESPINDDEIIQQANEIVSEVKSKKVDKNKMNKFGENLKKIYNFIDKTTELAKVINSISTFIASI